VREAVGASEEPLARTSPDDGARDRLLLGSVVAKFSAVDKISYRVITYPF
jgi:hypothetical protein